MTPNDLAMPGVAALRASFALAGCLAAAETLMEPQATVGPKIGERFRDCVECPEMAVVPAATDDQRELGRCASGEFMVHVFPASVRNVRTIANRYAVACDRAFVRDF